MRTKKQEFLDAIEAYVELYFTDDMTINTKVDVSDVRSFRKRELLKELYKLICTFIFPIFAETRR